MSPFVGMEATHLVAPVAESIAYTWLPFVPTYTTPLTTAGEDSVPLAMLAVHSVPPEAASMAYRV